MTIKESLELIDSITDSDLINAEKMFKNLPKFKKISKDELITKQQLEIESLKQEVNSCLRAIKKVDVILHCIGGPLNDNNKKFTNEQLKTFVDVKHALGL